MIYLAFFLGFGVFILVLPSARSNAQSAGLTLAWLGVISAVMATLYVFYFFKLR